LATAVLPMTPRVVVEKLISGRVNRRGWSACEWLALGRGGGNRRCGVAETGHGCLGEVAALSDGPLVVLFDDHGGDEPLDGGVVGEHADDIGASLDLAVQPLEVGIGPGRAVGLSPGAFPRPAPPNRTCAFPRIRLSTGPCRTIMRRCP
jgi:hypothetical protein